MTTSDSTPALPAPQEWLAELAPLLGLHDEIDLSTVLDVAGDAAHGIARVVQNRAPRDTGQA